MKILVGYTGFVGSNIYEHGSFDAVYNSKNISDAYGTNPDLLIYSGLRAEKYLANNAPEKDYELILQAQDNIRLINPKKLVLISTIDVFKNPVNVDEDSIIDTDNLHAYGLNRYKLEVWVRENYPDALIIRLPGLFGKNIKKNFIYDYIQFIPFMLKDVKMQKLTTKASVLNNYYSLQDNGFYKLKADLSKEERTSLKSIFKDLGFSALNFTDSRSVYQFYNLAFLYKDIETALANDIKLWHPATYPVSASEVYKYLCGEEFINELGNTPAFYDYKTKYSTLFGGADGYIATKEQVLNDIKKFVEGNE